MLGIKETKDVVRAGIKMGIAFSDGIGLDDIGVITVLPAALSGIADVPAELADLDAVEARELHQYVVDEFDIDDNDVEAVIEQAIKVVIEIYRTYMLFKVINEKE